MSHEVKIFFMVLCAVLAVPLGLFVNSVGWFAFGWLQTHAVMFWVKHPDGPLTSGTSRLFHVSTLRSLFGIEKNGLYSRAQFYEELISVRFSEGLSHTHHVEGLKRLVRSTAVIDMLASFYFVSIQWYREMLLAILALSFLLLLLSLLEYYQSLSILFRAYILSIRRPEDVANENESKLLINLLQAAELLRKPAAK